MTNVAKTGNPYKVGDILHHQWLCTMEFPEYYLVTRVTPRKVEVMRLSNRIVSGDGWIGYEAPDMTRRDGRKSLCSIRPNGKVLVDSYLGLTAGIWDGEPKYANHLD